MSIQVKRLSKEWEKLQKEPVEYVTAGPKNESDLTKWIGTLVGPSDTPYEGGVFQLEIFFPENYPYMPLKEDEYLDWFTNDTIPVGHRHCLNVERLLDIQPDGSANFCVDFIDCTIGNVRKNSLKEIWNSKEAEKFREFRRLQPLPVCHRCGAKYMSVPFNEYQ